MAIVTYPLNGIMYNAENAETYLCTRTSGVYSADDNFSVQADGTMQVTVNPGLAWIKNGDFAGKSVVSTEPVILSFAMADGVLNRKDRIVLRFDVGENATNIVVKQGTPASTAEPKAIERTGTVYELGLYVVDIPAGTLGLSAANITSTMLDESVCGIMRDGVTGIPTAQLQEQAMALMEQVAESVNQWKQEQTAEFEEWFEGIKGVLDGDTAGNLLNMIQQETADRQAADSAIESKLGVNATAVYEESTVKITAPEGIVVVTFLAPSDCKAGDKYTLNGDVLTLTDLNGEIVEDAWKQGSPVTFTLNGNKAFFKAGGGGIMPQIIVSAPVGSTVTATLGGETYTAQEQSGKWVIDVPAYGTYTVTAMLGEEKATAEVAVTAVQQYPIKLDYPAIYGAEWDGTSTTVWSRTDKAAGFANPVPYVQGQISYGSPFDKIMPWSGMVRVTDSVAGELVAIPKFWFKWTKSGSRLKLQIADKPVSGFHTSPAHADRGDGKGERDTVYIGRYHCADDWKSKTGVLPKASITRSTARDGIHSLGEAIWQNDIQIRTTIWMLYLVEFADWNSQKAIGHGCGNNSDKGSMGYTDTMPYHTGTTQNSLSSYGLGMQYRYIEGLWDNVYDWGDGCYYNSAGLNIIMNPNQFSDIDGGIAVGVPASGWPSAFAVATKSGLEWCIYPSGADGSAITYLPDNWTFVNSFPCLYFGGDYVNNLDRGLFGISCHIQSGAKGDIGCRLQKLP